MFKTFASVAALCCACFVMGCESTQSTGSSSSMGAVSSEKSCAAGCSTACCDKKAEGSMGAVGEGNGCCKDKAKACPMTGASDASMGAVSDQKKSGCCKSKAGCGEK